MNVDSRNINSTYHILLCNLDVHPNLASITMSYDCDYIETIESSVTVIHLSNKTCNDWNYNTFNFSRFSLLEELEIGEYSFMYVNQFVINGMNHLKSLIIGMNSFTSYYDEQSVFQILNCIELESIEIGKYSFEGYGGGFELRNLPKLLTIKIGEIGNEWSPCFYSSSFMINGILNIIWILNRSSTFEFY